MLVNKEKQTESERREGRKEENLVIGGKVLAPSPFPSQEKILKYVIKMYTDNNHKISPRFRRA
jgi:hypothetical protein